MGLLDEEFVDPGTFPAVLQTEIETDGEIGKRRFFIADQINDAIERILQQVQETCSDGRLVERRVPGIVLLHVAHQEKQ